MRILVVGGGAIGSFLAARLTEARAWVALAARPRTVEAVKAQGGLRVVAIDGREKLLDVPVFPSVAAAFAGTEEDRTPTYDLMILAVKSYHTETAGQELLAAGANGIPLLTIQNGVGNEELLAGILPESPLLAGVLTTPVEVLGPGYIKISRPSFKFGLARVSEKLKIKSEKSEEEVGFVGKVAELLTKAGFAVTTYDDYRAMKWSKLLMNILANAQSAILGYTPAQIFDDPRLGNLELRAWREALAVMRVLGVKPVSVGGYPIPLAAHTVQRLPLGLMRPIFARFIVGGRGEKMPSLYYDLHPQRRAHSEIDWLNGAVAREGERLGIPTPVNTTFTRILRALISGEEAVADWADQPEKLLAAVEASGKL
jgi:2-dehydropantoate 2-reductase